MAKSAAGAGGTTTVPAGFGELLERLRAEHADLEFIAGQAFCWSPARQRITYATNASGLSGIYSLLHELGHATLAHTRYAADFELLSLEVAAWEQAKLLAPAYGLHVSGDHVEDCLDSYRDWLYRRSMCPSCATIALQEDDQPRYRCYNCHASWRVAPSRFCRPYRLRAVMPQSRQ